MKIIQERDTTTIRQIVTFSASPEQVYEVIMDSKKHEALSGEKASISREIGGTFTAWGEHISGFNLVLQPGRKIVQAWRARDWWADHYSIATFELRQMEVGTELRFTQIGVPPHRFDGHSRGAAGDAAGSGSAADTGRQPRCEARRGEHVKRQPAKAELPRRA